MVDLKRIKIYIEEYFVADDILVRRKILQTTASFLPISRVWYKWNRGSTDEEENWLRCDKESSKHLENQYKKLYTRERLIVL